MRPLVYVCNLFCMRNCLLNCFYYFLTSFISSFRVSLHRLTFYFLITRLLLPLLWLACNLICNLINLLAPIHLTCQSRITLFSLILIVVLTALSLFFTRRKQQGTFTKVSLSAEYKCEFSGGESSLCPGGP